MKQYAVGLIVLLGMAVSARAQGLVNITIDAGLLEEADGITTAPSGSLLELIASPSGNFSAPTSGSYVTGDNILVTSFAADYVSSGTTGETDNALPPISLMASNFTLTPGEALLLRFYPSLTLASEPSSPPVGSSYGQVRSNTLETFQSGNADTAQTSWVVPSSGAVDLDYITVSDGGNPNGTTYTDSTAFATNVVLAGVAVPEPSTWATLGAGLTALIGLAMWKRRLGIGA